jgi:predicted kinase
MREPFAPFIEAELKPPFLLVTCGLPATLKTTVAAYIAGLRGCQVLSTDTIRRELLPEADIYDEAAAADPAKRGLVYEEMFRRAAKELSGEGCLILDGTFYTGALRRRAAALAAGSGKTLVILETRCPPEVAIGRIEGRARGDTASNALTVRAYRENEKSFEPVDLDELKRAYPTLDIIHLVVDTTRVEPEGWGILSEKRV